MKKLAALFLTGLLALGSTAVAGKEFRIAVINVPEVLQASPQAAAVRDKMMQEFQTREEDIVKKQETLQKQEQQLARDSAIMSDSARQALQEEIMENQSELIALQESFQEDAMRRQNEETQALLMVIGKELEAIAQEGEFDMIIHRDAVPYIADENYDITSLVIKKLNEGKKK